MDVAEGAASELGDAWADELPVVHGPQPRQPEPRSGGSPAAGPSGGGACPDGALPTHQSPGARLGGEGGSAESTGTSVDARAAALEALADLRMQSAEPLAALALRLGTPPGNLSLLMEAATADGGSLSTAELDLISAIGAALQAAFSRS